MRFGDFEDEIDNEIDDKDLGTLAQVSLDSFSASPAEIGPFGQSVLRWKVNGPIDGRFHLELNRQVVAVSGSKTVQPNTRKRFTLKVHAGRFFKTLGTVFVDVDLTSCESFEFNFGVRIGAVMASAIENRGGLSLKRDPLIEVDTQSNRIHLNLKIEKKVENWRNPTVYIDVYFGLILSDDVIQARDQEVSVDIDWPSETWLIPGAFIAIPLINSTNEAELKSDFLETTEELARLADRLSGFGSDRIRRELKILPPNGGNGRNDVFLEVMHCADPSAPQLVLKKLEETVLTIPTESI